MSEENQIQTLHHRKRKLQAFIGPLDNCEEATKVKRPRVDLSLKNLDLSYLFSQRDDEYPEAEQGNDLYGKLQINAILEEVVDLLKNNIPESINLMRSYLDDSHVKTLSQALRTNKSLKELNLSMNDNIGKAGILSLADALKHNNTLKTLIINDICDDEERRMVLPLLADNQTLVSLSIDNGNNIGENCNLRATEMRLLSNILLKNKTLKKLDLGFNDIDDEGLRYFADVFLSPTIALKEISLRGNKFTDRGVDYLANALKKNATITKLNLRCNEGITDKGVNALIEMLKVNRTLMKLKFEGKGLIGRKSNISKEKKEEIQRIMMNRNNGIFEIQTPLQGFYLSPLSNSSSSATTTTTSAAASIINADSTVPVQRSNSV